MNLLKKGYGTKDKQNLHQNIKEKTLNYERLSESCRYKREWETILNLISQQMPSDTPKKEVVEELVEVKRGIKIRKKRIPRMVEEF